MRANRLLQLWLVFGATVSYASPIPVGGRKYIIREQQDSQVKIVPEATRVDGSYMRDPEKGVQSRATRRTAKKEPESGQSRTQPVIVHTEKTFKPLKVVGKLLQPSVEFEREYIDIAQMESMPDRSFIQPLMESLDALE